MRTSPAVAAAVLVFLLPAAGSTGGQVTATCPEGIDDPALADRIEGALGAGRDVWGEALLASPEGPTHAGASRFLPPLLLARAAGRTRLTASGVHYVPFSQPAGAQGGLSVALHVADGSEIHRPACRWRATDSRGRPRTIRPLPRQAGAANPRRGVSADPANRLRRRPRCPVPRGVLHYPRCRSARPRELRTRHGRHPRCDRRHDRAIRGPSGRPLGRRETGRCPDGRGCVVSRSRGTGAGRRGRVRCGAPLGRAVLADASTARCELSRPGAARDGRTACSPDPESRAHVAVQPRQRLRAVLISRRRRRGAGDEFVRLRRRRALRSCERR